MTTPPPDDPRAEVLELCDRLFDGDFTVADRERLEALVIGNAEARLAYLEQVQIHAVLKEARLKDVPLSEVVNMATALTSTSAPRTRVSSTKSRWTTAALALAASIAILLAGWGMGHWQSAASTERAFVAKLVDAKGVRWDSGTLPTEVGASLSQGRLRLASGLATVEFRKGARVTLEGPADLEIINGDKCYLHRGALTAHVPPPAVGFMVETANAKLVDHGTDFGISAGTDGAATVEVFDGEVEVFHQTSGQRMKLLTKQGASVSTEELSGRAAADDDSETELPRARRTVQPLSGNTVTITSADGRGKAAYAFSPQTTEHFSDTLLLLKHTPLKPACRRKAWLAFDLAAVQGRDIAEAGLTLTFEPTGWGYASLLPDAVFTVYGVTDSSADYWDEATLDWNNAPANDVAGGGGLPDKAVKLGTFTMPQGVLEGAFTVKTPELAEFLQRDANRLATLVIVRETTETKSGSVVHGFAGNRHPTLRPPTLRMVVR